MLTDGTLRSPPTIVLLSKPPLCSIRLQPRSVSEDYSQWGIAGQKPVELAYLWDAQRTRVQWLWCTDAFGTSDLLQQCWAEREVIEASLLAPNTRRVSEYGAL